ncbi:2TM domain-containing protein [Hyphomicrobium sp.]|uniref:2TM domain-containing protein n=1 Tax=Hyphomicrobium sp. TaxID=82 RepID=UPI0025C1E407|nr:2TM domain-containing protein [Hyphomicrobium sp.]MCC7253793.1 2TM domain-containing protein [Hyphomicrobium sp.]
MSISLDDLRRHDVLTHASIFAVVIVALAILDWYTAEPYWVHWVFLGWGAGVLAHAWLALRC